MKMPLKSIYYFESVARLGSYSAAAREMFVTHAAVISQIKALEQWMGKKLVYRQQNRVMLTEAGAAFAAQLTDPFAQLRDAVQTHRKEGHNKLVIGCLPSLATCFLLPHIHDFKTRYPDIELTLQYQLAAAENTADFVLGFTDEALAETAQELFSGATVPVCGREYAAKIDEFSANCLNQYDLLHDEDHRAWQRWYERYADVRTAGAPLSQVSRGTVFSDFNMMRIAAINNNGIALCPKALIATELSSGELVQLSPLAGNRNRRYYLRVNGVSGDSQRAFSDWVMALAQSKIA